MPASLRLLGLTELPETISAPVEAPPLTTSLQRLQQVCAQRRQTDHRLEIVGCELAWSLARLVIEAKMVDVPLPRHYVARLHCGEAHLAKYAAIADATKVSGEDELLFLLTRRDSMFARLEPRARELSRAQILEFMSDIENGFIEEIADFIAACNSTDERAALCFQEALASCRTITSKAVRNPIAQEVVALETPHAPDLLFPLPTRALPGRKPRARRLSPG